MIAALRAMLFCAGLTLACAAPAAEAPPVPGTPRDFVLPPAQTLTLDNGLQATLIDYGIVPQVTLVAAVAAGNVDEGQQTWLADLVGDALELGAGSRDAAAFARATADLGGELSVSVGADQTLLSLTVLGEHAAAAVALLADVLQRPQLPAGELPRLKADRARLLSIAQSDPGSLADVAFYEAIYGDHPYGRLLPTAAQLETYTAADVQRFFAGHFGAGRTRLYVAGRFDQDAVRNAIRAAFSSWAPGAAPERPRLPDAPAPVLRRIPFPAAPQSVLRLGMRVPGPRDADFLPFTVANALLGGGLPSRITSNLRERHGYAYSPSTAAIPQLAGSHWLLDAEVTTAHTADALREALAEIQRLRSETPGSDELEGIRNYRVGLFVIRSSTPQGLIGQLAFRDLHGLPEDYLTTQVARIRAVTPLQVSEVVRRWLDPGRMSLVVVGDPASVDNQVPALPGGSAGTAVQ
jgi:predicted Zn-dependent peptidase